MTKNVTIGLSNKRKETTMTDKTLKSKAIDKRATKKVANLKVQAMMFDMDVDWETLTLVAKHKDTTPTWIKRWQEKQAESDYTVYDNGN